MRKALIACLLWLGMTSSVLEAQGKPQPAAPLFTDLPSAVAPHVQSFEAVRSRPVRIALESLAEADRSQAAGVRGKSRVKLNLFPDVEVTAVLTEVTPTNIGFAWVGTLAGIPESHVTLVYGKGILVGNITRPGSAYRVMYTPAGVHVIEEVDPRAFPPELDPIPVPESDGELFSVTGELGTVTAPADSGATFDVLVVYTTAARTAAGGTAAIQNLINLGVSETNTAYANSGIIPRLNLVYSAEISPYTESGDLSTDLARLKNPTDGYMDIVHSWRNQYGADLVKLVVSTSAAGACGVAYLMCGSSGAGFESSAFSVTARNCISPNYTFGHELGHNMGSNHAPDDPTGCGAFNYSFGYKDPQARFRTVMAYDCGASCPRVLRFSNPNLFYNGWVTGTSTQNNALSINNVRTVVANFRQTASSVSQVYPPTGWVDGFDQQYIWGWACDPDYPTQSNRVDIYTTSWQYLGSANANLSSSAPINSACRGGSAHYFSFYHNGGVAPGTHFMVWSIDLPYNTPGNDNRRIAGTGGINGGNEFVMPVSQAYAPTGWVDGYDRQHIWGWACDPDYPTQSNRVDIYTTSWQYLGSADAILSSSAPINSACRGGSAHYFDFRHNGSIPPGTHFMVWSIDLPYNTPGNDNRRIAGTGGIGGNEFVVP
jgi:peptidyl-Asp metalloendopeptidase